MTTNLIIDANSIGRTYHGTRKLTYGGMETQAIYGTLRGMRDYFTTYRGSNKLALWDGRAQWRFDMFPAYKSKREELDRVEDKKRYAEQRPHIQRVFELIGISQLTVKNAEADDMAGYLSKVLIDKNPASKVVLVTKDDDWLQLVQGNVTLHNIKIGEIFNAKNFLSKTGYLNGRLFLAGKALQGDTSDDIPGVGGLGETYAAEFIAKYGSIENFLNQMPHLETTAQDVLKKALKTLPKREVALAYVPQGLKVYKRNLILMNLIDVQKPDKEQVIQVAGKFDEGALWQFCEEFGFNSLLHDFKNFVRPFKNTLGV